MEETIDRQRLFRSSEARSLVERIGVWLWLNNLKREQCVRVDEPVRASALSSTLIVVTSAYIVP